MNIICLRHSSRWPLVRTVVGTFLSLLSLDRSQLHFLQCFKDLMFSLWSELTSRWSREHARVWIDKVHSFMFLSWKLQGRCPPRPTLWMKCETGASKTLCELTSRDHHTGNYWLERRHMGIEANKPMVQIHIDHHSKHANRHMTDHTSYMG